VTLGYVFFVSQDFHVSSDEAIGDASSVVDVGAFHDDCVLYLCDADGEVVSDDGGPFDGGPAVDDGVSRCTRALL